MARVHETAPDVFEEEDHQVAYIFDAEESETRQQRPTKRRRVSKQTKQLPSGRNASAPFLFAPLLGGAEGASWVQARHDLFRQSWDKIERRINKAMRDSNSATLDEVASFVGGADALSFDKIPAAFIITGTNMASQNLLFEQLSESLQKTPQSRFVRLRSSEATSLKATLKKIIRDVTNPASAADEEDDIQIGNGQDALKGYLDYDLEALYAFVKSQECDRVFIAFEDSEGFDSSLFFDLIPLLNSWRPHIPFTLLFGIATSVDLLQARLSKSICQQIYGAQFDAIQAGTIMETVFKIAVVADDVPIRLGPPLLRGLLDRQRDHLAGVQAFVSSLKYAYMCHFYANALSPLLAVLQHNGGEPLLQSEQLESVRNLPSFRALVESHVDNGDAEGLERARSLVEDDETLIAEIKKGQSIRDTWVRDALRALLVQEAAGALQGEFSSAYIAMLGEGTSASEHSRLVECVRQLEAPALASFLRQTIHILKEGDPILISQSPTASLREDADMERSLSKLLTDLEALRALASEAGITLRSSYSGQGKIMRTTVIAQRVQLSRDTAALREQDKQFTSIVDGVTRELGKHIRVSPLGQVFLSESWTYDSHSPLRDVLVPRPRLIFERSLTRPHDYLGCNCCKDGSGGIQATLPATAILYQLYLETGNLINVADLWSAFHGHVSQDEEDERKILFSFYRGLAELKTLGFVKSSKKKADHIAKLKWL